MEDANHIRTLEDYSKPSHEGYRNTIELPEGNNVVPLRSDTIRLVQNGCSFYGLRSEDPNQHLKDFLKLMDSLDLDGNDPRDFAKQVKAISLPQDVLSTSDRHLIELEHQVQRLMEAYIAPIQPTQVNNITSSCEICSGPRNTQYCMENPEQAFVEYASSRTDEVGGLVSNFMASQDARLSKFEADFKQQQIEMTNKIDTVLKAISDRIAGALLSDTPQPATEIRTQQPEEPEKTLEDEFKDLHLNLPVLKVLAHAPMYNAILEKYVESLELGKNRSTFIQGEMPKKIEDPRLFTLPLGRGFLATANAVIDYRKAKIVLGEGITSSDGVGAQTPYYARKDFLDCHLPGEWEIARDAEINPFKDVLVFIRMVEFLGAIPINLKRNMWESEDLIRNPINWDKSPKNGDGPWHAKIRLINPDGEEFTKTLQSVPTSRKLTKKEDPREIIDLDHFYDT
ncbi:hypothetical protein Tco_1021358 [Tanacetum coccineum]